MKHAFSRQASKVKAIEIKQRRAKLQAKKAKPEMKLKHPDWIRDAAKGQYSLLEKSVKEECEKKQLRNETFTRKLHELS